MTPRAEFHRQAHFDRPELLGARWWHEGLANAADTTTRRQALALFAVTGASVVGFGIFAHALSSHSPPRPPKTWGDVTFPGACTVNAAGTTVEPRSVRNVTDALRPSQAALAPDYGPTLFQTVDTNPGLEAVLVPIFTPDMAAAFAKGEAVRDLFQDKPGDTAIVVDLPGPEGVAFAAALVRNFDPVFVFDNLAHPEGIVPAHLTIAAAIYYLPTLVNGRGPDPRPPVFVLDRNRTVSYDSNPAVFDNRFRARLPGTARLTALGIKHVLVVVPGDTPVEESQDLTDDFVTWYEAGIDIKMLHLSDLFRDGSTRAPVPQPGGPSTWTYRYGGQTTGHVAFWTNYGWHPAPPSSGVFFSGGLSSGWTYVPRRRALSFSRPSPSYSSPYSSPSSPSHWSDSSHSSSFSGGSLGRSSGSSGG